MINSGKNFYAIANRLIQTYSLISYFGFTAVCSLPPGQAMKALVNAKNTHFHGITDISIKLSYFSKCNKSHS